MRIFLLILFAALFCSCYSDHFQFDQVEHYSLKNDDVYNRLMAKEKITAQEETYLDILNHGEVPDLQEPVISKELEAVFGKSQGISNDKLGQLRDIYTAGVYVNILSTRCLAVYRDVLVFKNKGTVTGISKICFDCDKHITVDSYGRSLELNKSAAFKELKKILY